MAFDSRLGETIKAYDALAAEYADEWFYRPLSPQMELFTSFLPAGAKVLDAGGGHGRDSAELSKKGFEPCLLDLSAGLLAEARRRNAAVCSIQGDVRSLPFSSSSFNGIWACASLVHLERQEIRGAFLEMARVASRRGVLFVSLRLGEGKGWEEWKGFRRFYTYVRPGEAIDMMKEGGWEVRWWAEEAPHWFSAIGIKR